MQLQLTPINYAKKIFLRPGGACTPRHPLATPMHNSIIIVIINKVLIKVTLNKVITGALYIVCA